MFNSISPPWLVCTDRCPWMCDGKCLKCSKKQPQMVLPYQPSSPIIPRLLRTAQMHHHNRVCFALRTRSTPVASRTGTHSFLGGERLGRVADTGPGTNDDSEILTGSGMDYRLPRQSAHSIEHFSSHHMLDVSLSAASSAIWVKLFTCMITYSSTVATRVMLWTLLSNSTRRANVCFVPIHLGDPITSHVNFVGTAK